MTHENAAIANSKSWKRSLAKTMAGTWLHAIARLLLYVTITKVSGLQELGAWALGVGIAEPVLKFTNLGLRPVHATDTERRLRFSRVFAIRAAMLIVALAVCTMIVLNTTNAIFFTLIIAAILGRVAESLSDIALGEFQRSRAFLLVAASGAARFAVTLAAVLIIYLGGDLELTLLGLVSAMLLLGSGEIAIAWRLDRRSKRDMATWEALPLRDVLISAVQLGLVAFVITYLTHVNRYAANWFGSLADVGILAIAAILIAFGQTFVRGMSIALLPMLSVKDCTEKPTKRNIYGTQVGIVLITLVLGVTLAIVGEPLLTFAFTENVGTQTALIGSIFAISGIRYACSLQNVRLMASQKFGVQTPYLIPIFAFGSTVSFGCFAAFGLWGAVLANLLIWSGIYLLRSYLLAKLDQAT